MSRALRALAWLAPQAAAARAQALAAVDASRGYDGASVGRRGDSFVARPTSANVEIGPALGRLRDRSRDMARNTADGRRVVDVRTAHAIGTGILAVPDNGSDRIDNRVKQEWADWCAVSDVEGELDFNGQQVSAYGAMMEGGESLLRRVWRPLGGGPRVPLQLQVLEGDYIDTTRTLGTYEGVNTRLGIGLGDWNRRSGYWLHPYHPGEQAFQATSFVSKFVTSSEVIHLYRALRPGQLRGVPVFAPVLMNERDLADLLEAVLVKAKTEACFTAFVKTTGQTPNSLGKTLQEGVQAARRIIERLAPGMINYLNPGEEVSFGQPSSTAGSFEPIYLAGKQAVASGTGITYDQLTGDLRQANYSSLKAGERISRRLVEQEQEILLVPKLMRRVTGWWTDAALLAGVLPPRKDGYRWNFVMPAVEPIDPRKDLEADILAVRSGRMTPQDFIGSWGMDWRKALADRKAFFATADADGIVLDIDPRRTSQLGVAQNADDEPDDTPPGTPPGPAATRKPKP